MRITFILPHASLAGGIRVVAIYANLLKQRGHQVTVVSVPKRPLNLKQKLVFLLKNNKFPFMESGKSYFDNVNVKHIVLEKYRNVSDEDVPDSDLVIATYWITAEWASDLSGSKGKKVYFIQGKEADFPGLPTERVRKTYALPLKKITISRSLYGWLLNQSDDKNISIILNSVDTAQFSASLRNKQSNPTIGVLYSDAYIKGFDVSIKAIKIIKEKYANLKIISFGVSPIGNHFQLPKNFEYYQQPPQEEIAELYSKCDVWLCGSRMEGFHLPPLEAMACRCPVVSTAVGGPIDIIQDGINGYIVPVNDHEKLAEAVINVLSLSNEDWLKMSAHAYQTAHSYTWDDATDHFEKKLVEIFEG